MSTVLPAVIGFIIGSGVLFLISPRSLRSWIITGCLTLVLCVIAGLVMEQIP